MTTATFQIQTDETELRSQAFPTVFKPKWAVRLFIAERKLTLKAVTDYAQPKQPGMVGLTEAMAEQFNQWLDSAIDDNN